MGMDGLSVTAAVLVTRLKVFNPYNDASSLGFCIRFSLHGIVLYRYTRSGRVRPRTF